MDVSRSLWSVNQKKNYITLDILLHWNCLFNIIACSFVLLYINVVVPWTTLFNYEHKQQLEAVDTRHLTAEIYRL